MLDVGCGAGWTSRMIAKRVPEGEVVGIDFAENMIKNAKMKSSQDNSHDYDNLRFEVADVENISCPDDHFDYAICIESLDWFSDPKAAIKEIRRVLKPDGKLYVSDGVNSRLTRFFVKFFRIFLGSSLDKYTLYSETQFREFFELEFTGIYQKYKGGVLLTRGTKK